MLCIRYGQGTDYLSYEYYYHLTPSSLNLKYALNHYHLETGYIILMNIIKSCGLSFEVFVVIVSLFMMVMLNRFISTYSKNRCMSLLLFYPTYFLTYYFSAIRQGIVMAIFIGILIPLISDRKWIKYIIVCYIANQFHSCAVVLYLVPIICAFRLDKIYLLVVFSVIVALLIKITGMQHSIVLMFGAQEYIGVEMSYLGVLRKMVECLVLILLGVVKIKDEDKLAPLIKMYFFGVILSIVFLNNSLISLRLSAFFDLMSIAIIPSLVYLPVSEDVNVSDRLNKGNSFVCLCVVLCLSSAMVIKNIDSYITQGKYYNKSIRKYPYITVFDKDEVYSYRPKKYNLVD